MKRQPAPPERPRQRLSGCRGLLLGLLAVVVAAGLFVLRWLWLLARSKRPSESVADAVRRAIAPATAERPQRQGVGLRRIDLFVGGLVLLGLALIPLAIWGVPDWLTQPAFLSAWRDEPQAAWLQTGRAWAPDDAERVAGRATESARLDSYGWHDEEAGVARIPVERAMGLLLERGESLVMTPLPGASPQATATSTPVAEPDEGNAQAGEQLFSSLGCDECHVPDGTAAGPSLSGVFGSQVQLESGGTDMADAEYVRRSILDPQAQIVAGYEPVMPSFEGEVSEQELQDLVAYIRSLSQEAP